MLKELQLNPWGASLLVSVHYTVNFEWLKRCNNSIKQNAHIVIN